MPKLVAVDPVMPDPATIAGAADVLRRGGLVAFPTETVYGLGASAFDVVALARVFAAKGRPAHHPLIAHVIDAFQARELAASWPDAAAVLAEAFWPGPLTLVVDRAPQVPAELAGGGPSVALRAPGHAVARALVEALGNPVAAPSANAYQGVSPTRAAHVTKQLGDAVDLVLDGGPCEAGIESTVVDVRGGRARVLRPGAVDVVALRRVLPHVEVPALGARTAGEGEARESPGMDARHYSPRAPLELTADGSHARARAAELAAGGAKVGLVAFGDPPPAGAPPGPAGVVVRLLPDDPRAYARVLYATLHDLDDASVDAIVVQDVPWQKNPSWLGVADRLARAAGQRVR